MFEIVASLFIGAVGGSTLTRMTDRIHQRGELARDALVDLNSLITALEDALPALAEVASADPPTGAEDLVDTPSGFNIGGPTLSLECYLSCLDDEELHRLFMLIFDRFRSLAEISNDATKAFDWLILNGDTWDTPLGRESQTVLRDMRRDAYRSVCTLLRCCAEACALLAKDPPFSLFRFRRPSILSFVAKHYKLTARDLQLRAAYYRRTDVTSAFKPNSRLGVYRWMDTSALASDSAFLEIRLQSDEAIMLAAGEYVALPAGANVAGLRATLDRGESWETVPIAALRKIPAADHDGTTSFKLTQNARVPLMLRAGRGR